MNVLHKTVVSSTILLVFPNEYTPPNNSFVLQIYYYTENICIECNDNLKRLYILRVCDCKVVYIILLLVVGTLLFVVWRGKISRARGRTENCLRVSLLQCNPVRMRKGDSIEPARSSIEPARGNWSDISVGSTSVQVGGANLRATALKPSLCPHSAPLIALTFFSVNLTRVNPHTWC